MPVNNYAGTLGADFDLADLLDSRTVLGSELATAMASPSDSGVAALIKSTTSLTTAALQVFRTVVSVKAYGAKGDGVTDDTSAIQSAINAVQTSGGRVFFPPGTYIVSATLNITGNGTTLRGASRTGATIKTTGMAGAVVLQFGNGITQLQDCGVFDLSITSPAAKTGGAAIDMNNCFRTLVQRVNTYLQYVGIRVHNSFITSITDCDIRVTGLDGIQFDNDLGKGNDCYIANVTADNGTTATGAGINWTGGEALVVSNSDFLRFTEGIQVAPTTGRQARFGFFTNVMADTCSDSTWRFTNAAGGDVVAMTLTNCWAGTATNYGIMADGGGTARFDGLRIDSSKVLNNGLAGVRIVGAAKRVSLTNSEIIANSQTTVNARSGVEVTAGVTDFLISGNHITNAMGLNANQGNGIAFDAGATDWFVITGNDLRGNGLASISGLAGVTGTNGKVSDNLGFNPRGAVTAPAVPASTVALINPTNCNATAYVVGGTVTAISVGGTATGLTAGAVRVAAGQTITLTYSVAPTWVWIAD